MIIRALEKNEAGRGNRSSKEKKCCSFIRRYQQRSLGGGGI